jgi:hypothetical protein
VHSRWVGVGVGSEIVGSMREEVGAGGCAGRLAE